MKRLTLDQVLLYEALMDENGKVDDQEWRDGIEALRKYKEERKGER
jgi:hypothetical protein